MSEAYFTSDSHFQHARIIEYCNRPFNSVQEMNITMIENWNAVVNPADTVYHLGDFAFINSATELELLTEKLNGIIHLITGDHDRYIDKHKKDCYKYFGSITENYKKIKVNGREITLCHYAMKKWHKSHYGTWHLYGHSHGSLLDDPNSLSFDVGVDCHNFTPLHFDQVKETMNKKMFKPIDHHGEKSV